MRQMRRILHIWIISFLHLKTSSMIGCYKKGPKHFIYKLSRTEIIPNNKLVDNLQNIALNPTSIMVKFLLF